MPLLSKCFNCRIQLPEGSNHLQCPKCEKNEKKYGKPVTCQYCKLNAAFHDQKCVWCSDSERKFGNPYECTNCKLTCAFPRRESDKNEDVAKLCRVCIMQARQTNQTVVAGIPVPPNRKDRSREGSSSEHRDDRHRRDSSRRRKERTEHHKSGDKRHRDQDYKDRDRAKRRHHDEPMKNGSSGVPPLAPSNENGNGLPLFGGRDNGENMEKQQRMEEEIRRLKAQLAEKEVMIFDKDKEISNLKADKYNLEKKHRERVQQLVKEKEESIRAIELMRNSKNAKKN
ncbi:hypothetical protein B9Z55_002430 [Caenorhabditis nigoni]|uniref:Uncharacterized protein n=1 Tax=Caenorhabditis nigoni TaxID=1611254 RepID=A0A2G5VKK0_9PELO|nr:hypothetical protein B9Z55_002430 [Caenorhabditis nigoni]